MYCSIKYTYIITKRYTNREAPKKYAKRAARSNFLGSCSGCANALLIFQKQKTFWVAEN